MMAIIELTPKEVRQALVAYLIKRKFRLGNKNLTMMNMEFSDGSVLTKNIRFIDTCQEGA